MNVVACRQCMNWGFYLDPDYLTTDMDHIIFSVVKCTDQLPKTFVFQCFREVVVYYLLLKC